VKARWSDLSSRCSSFWRSARDRSDGGLRALFVERFGRANLPLAFAIIPVVAVILTAVTISLIRRTTLRRLLAFELALLLAVAVTLRIGIGRNLGFVIFVLPASDAATNSLNNLIVWTTAGRLLDVRRSKRLGALIIADRSAGQVIAGLAVRPIVGAIGTRNLYLVEFASFAMGGVALIAIVRMHRQKLASVPVVVITPDSAGDDDATRRSRTYVCAVAVLALLTMIGYVMIRNIFLDRAAVQFPTSERYASAIGLVSAIHGLATLLASLFSPGASGPASACAARLPPSPPV
jgi:hypothetical protein